MDYNSERQETIKIAKSELTKNKEPNNKTRQFNDMERCSQ